MKQRVVSLVLLLLLGWSTPARAGFLDSGSVATSSADLVCTACVSLTAEVSGILPTANGGTGIAFFTAAGPTVARVYTFPDVAGSVPLLGTTNSFTALQTFAAGALLGSDDTLAWGNAVGGGTEDTILQREAANTLAMRNGLTGQIFNVYGNYTSATDNEYVTLRYLDASGRFELLVYKGSGGGFDRELLIGTFTTGSLRFVQNSSLRWDIGDGGHFITAADNAYDIGATGATRPRSVYVATSYSLEGANAQAMSLKQLTELTTIAAAATTSTTIQIPANSLVLGVTVRVTTTIPTAATFVVGVTGAATRYGTGILVDAGTTNASPGTTNPTIYSGAVSVLITPNLTPGDTTGQVRVTIHYLDLTAPAS